MRAAAGRRRAGPWFGGRPGLAVAVAVALFAGVLALRFAVESAQDPVTLLFCLPAALLATAFGRRGGLLGGLAATVLVALWVGVRQVDLSVLGWATMIVPLLLLGGLLGDAVDRLHRSEEERLRLEAAAQGHRDAVEINDSVVQRLAAAKWALESDRSDRALEIVTQTLDVTQALVSDLLRDAGMGVNGERGGRAPAEKR